MRSEFRDIVTLAWPKVFTYAISLSVYPYFLNNISFDIYGQYLIIIASLTIIESFYDLGLTSVVGKLILLKPSVNPFVIFDIVFRRLLVHLIVLSTLLVVMLMLGFDEVLGFLIFAFAVRSFHVLIKNVLLFKGDYRFIATLEVVETVLRNASFLLATLFSVVTLFQLAIILNASGVIISFVAFIIFSKKYYESQSKYSINRFRLEVGITSTYSLYRMSAGFLVSRLSHRIFFELPVILSGSLLGNETSAILGSTIKLGELVFTPFGILLSYLKSKLTRLQMSLRLKLLSLMLIPAFVLLFSLFSRLRHLRIFTHNILYEVLFSAGIFMILFFGAITEYGHRLKLRNFIYVLFAVLVGLYFMFNLSTRLWELWFALGIINIGIYLSRNEVKFSNS